ncbi:NUDIX domain-containing protein [Allorhizobium sp. BGMRC 0089]|uniref:NUDIX domain-containing protein n=1 Tax=Allorhizobium sonneratiae TaxID=2934936 RepID=UPI002033F3FD|nr:NUDIX domain-containing protein [Allorhizobium sonneratiae]MCM2292798.1 NUDIX domain-containing protein [Allorhizobium sonneratiae]
MAPFTHRNVLETKAADDHQHWPQDNDVFKLHRLELSISTDEHPFHRDHADAARRNWVTEVAAKPALFDGKLILFNSLTISEGEIEGVGHVIPYSTYLFWRKQPAPSSGYHLFGFPVIMSSDGALIAVEMASHTANAGMVYCPAGSLDPSDIVAGRVDVEANMRREVKEETGLDLVGARVDPFLYAYRRGRRVTVFRRFDLPLTSEEIFARITTHMETDHEQEIARPLAIRGADPHAHPYNPAMYPLLDYLFG